MILLDSDHLSVLRYPKAGRATRLTARLEASTDKVLAVAIVSIEEQMRGWLAAISKERKAVRQAIAYRESVDLFSFFNFYLILGFDESVALLYEQFRRIRIGSMDKKIAAVALANDALLLTANRRDFERIPGLRFENWMD